MKKILIFTVLLILGFCFNLKAQETVIIYPQNYDFWTGSVKNYNDLDTWKESKIKIGKISNIMRGWAIFDYDTIPSNADITEIRLVTTTSKTTDSPLVDIYDVNNYPIEMHNNQEYTQMFNDLGEGHIYKTGWNVFNEVGPHDIILDSIALTDLENAIEVNQGWWGVGFRLQDEEVSLSKRGQFDGWNQDYEPFCVVKYSIPSDPPIANFIADDQTPGIGQTVNFNDLSTNNPTSWAWSFDPTTVTYTGGTNSFSQNPQVQFTVEGYYKVTLTATNQFGSDTETKANYINVGGGSGLNANFIADQTTIEAGGQVNFTDTSTGNPISWDWTFEGGNPESYNGQYPPSVTYNNAGIYDVSLQISNGTENDTHTENEYITVNAPSCLGYLLPGNLCLNGNISQNENIVMATGNVDINNVLLFDGDVNYDTLIHNLYGNCTISVDASSPLGIVQLTGGSFNWSINNGIMNLGNVDSMLFATAGLPVDIGEIKLLSDGVELSGKLQFPEVLGNLSIDIDTLQITQGNGVSIAGKIAAGNIKVRNTFNIDTLFLEFSTFDGQQYFICGGSVHTVKFGVEADAEIFDGDLNSVNLAVQAPVVLGSTGFKMTEIGGGVDNLINPPMSLSVHCDLEPVVSPPTELIKLESMGLTYTWGVSLEGTGDLSIYNEGIASVGFFINSEKMELDGEVSIGDYLNGEIGVGIYKRPSGIDLQGYLNASLQIPDSGGFPYGLIRAVVPLPYTIAQTDNYLYNTIVAGNFSLNPLTVHYKLGWENSSFDADFGMGYRPWSDILFPEKYLMNNYALNQQNRFEGKSLILSAGNLNPKAVISGSKYIQTFTIETLTPEMIVRVIDTINNVVPDYFITRPDSIEITDTNVWQYPDVHYLESTDDAASYFIVKNPELGDWQLNIDGIEDVYLVDVFGAENLPTIQLDSLPQINNTIKIKWTDLDIDNDAPISLYFDNDNKGANGVPIVEGLSEDSPDDFYEWVYPDTMATGDYYVYGVIKQGDSLYDISYSPNSVRIVEDSAPSAPYGLVGEIINDSLFLTWSDTNSIDVRYLVYYSTSPDISYSSSYYNIGNEPGYMFSSLVFQPGKHYYFFVSCIDSLYRQSDTSNIFDTGFIVSGNNAPTIDSIQQFYEIAFAGSDYLHQVYSHDPDNDPLTYDIECSFIDSLPGHIYPEIDDNTGLIEWSPDSLEVGVHQIKVRVFDDNATDSVTYTVVVYDTIGNEPQIEFNKPLYTCYENEMIIEVTDAKLPASPSVITINVSSEAYPQGMNLTATKTSPTSNTYKASVTLSETISGNGYLQVNETDSVQVNYSPVYGGDVGAFVRFEYNNFSVPLSITGDLDYCEGETIDTQIVVDSSFLYYIWQDSTTNNSFTVNELGSYFVKVGDYLGCTYSSDTVNVNLHPLPPKPLITANDITVFCDGGEVILSAPENYEEYIWTSGDTTQSIIVDSSGQFSVAVVDTFTCESPYSDTILVEVLPVPEKPGIEITGTTSFCMGDSVVLSGPSGTDFSYHWSNDSTTQSITVFETSDIYLTLIGENACESENSDTVQITVFELPVVDLGEDIIACDSVQLNALNGGSSFYWSNDSTSQAIMVKTSGFYSVTVTDTNYCFSSDTIHVTINPSTYVNLGNDTIVCGSMILDSNIPNAGNLWSTGDTSSMITAWESGLYWVEITNAYSCVSSDSINVVINPIPEVELGPDAVYCLGDSLDAGNTGNSVYWNTGDTTSVIYPETTGFYVVSVVTPEGCENSDSINIELENYTIADFEYEDSLLIVNFTNNSVYGENFIWYFGDGLQSFEESPEHTYAESGNYTVELVSFNDCNIDTVSKILTVSTLGINNEMLGNMVRIYPNPANDKVFIEVNTASPFKMNIILKDLSGRVLLKDENIFGLDGNIKSIDIGALPTGAYFLLLNSGKANTVQKLIKN